MVDASTPGRLQRWRAETGMEVEVEVEERCGRAGLFAVLPFPFLTCGHFPDGVL